MDFVDRDGRTQLISPGAGGHPGSVLPIIIEVPNHRRAATAGRFAKGKRIGLVDLVVAGAGDDVVLVGSTALYAREETFPDAGRSAGAEAVATFVPIVEIADYRNFASIRRPDREVSSDR